MMAPVQPKPTNTASTGFRVVVIALTLRPSGATLESDGRKGHPLSMAIYPLLVVIVGSRKTNHLPCAHILVAAVYWVGKITFLGVLQKHGEEGFGVDAAVKLCVSALQFLQQFVLIGVGELRKSRSAQVCADVLVDSRNSGAIQLRGTKPALIALFRRALWPRAAEVVMIASAEGACELAVKEEGYVGLDGTGSDGVIRDQPRHRCFNECCFG